jgi:RNA polymerase sigma-70 factor (ECF subfamily)
MKEDKTELIKLISLALEDDEKAWHKLVSSYTSFIFSVARKVLRRYAFKVAEDDLADIASDVWCNLIEKNRFLLERCRRRDNFLQTLYVLARNRAVDMLRKTHKECEFNEELHGIGAEADFSDPLSTVANGETLKEFKEPILSAMQNLNEKERTILTLFYMQGRRYKDIAEITGISQNSIGPTLQRALQKLRGALKNLKNNFF